MSLSAEERALYMRVHGDVYRRWQSFHAAGAAIVTRYQLTVSDPKQNAQDFPALPNQQV